MDLSHTTPTQLPNVLRAAAEQAFAMAADPLNMLDNNPHIAREWSAVGTELSSFAASIEKRVFLLFSNNFHHGAEAAGRNRAPYTPRLVERAGPVPRRLPNQVSPARASWWWLPR